MAAAALAVAACSPWSREPSRPSVVLLVVDALRPDHLGCYGYGRPTSPEMDRLAARSVRFAEAVSVSSWTKPAVPSLLTSLYPSQHGVWEGSGSNPEGGLESDALGEEAVTGAEVLSAAGYRAAAFVHNAQLRAAFGLAQGFEVYRELEASGTAVVEGALEWLDRVRRESPSVPFFVYLHLLDTHWPYEPPPEAAAALGATAGKRPDDYALREAVNRGVVALGDEELWEIVLRYDAEIRGVDRAVGRLVAGLESRGLFEGSVLVLTSDHGEAFLEHGRLGHGGDLYEESLRVPLLLKLPGSRDAGRVVRQRVTTLDVMPTILELAGLRPEAGVSQAGRSLLRFLGDGSRGETGPTFAEVRHGRTVQKAVCLDGWKLVRRTRLRDRPSQDLSSGGARQEAAALVGARLEVEGMRIGEEGFLSEEIELEEAGDDDDEVTGRIERVEPGRGTAVVVGFEVDIGRALVLDAGRRPLPPGSLLPGRPVKIEGRALGPRRFEASAVRLLKGEPETEVEGVVRRARAGPRGTVELLLAGLWVSARRRDLEQLGGSPSRARRAREQTVTFELYDLSRDPLEKNDLAGAERERVRVLAQALERWEAEASRAALPRTGRVALDEDTLDKLRALGYVR